MEASLEREASFDRRKEIFSDDHGAGWRSWSFKIPAGRKVAVVGSSGCGKSTIIQLLQRFYDPNEGEILIDGVPIKLYDLTHLRTQMGVVSQEPTLFQGTIEYNIR